MARAGATKGCAPKANDLSFPSIDLLSHPLKEDCRAFSHGSIEKAGLLRACERARPKLLEKSSPGRLRAGFLRLGLAPSHASRSGWRPLSPKTAHIGQRRNPISSAASAGPEVADTPTPQPDPRKVIEYRGFSAFASERFEPFASVSWSQGFELGLISAHFPPSCPRLSRASTPDDRETHRAETICSANVLRFASWRGVDARDKRGHDAVR